MRHSFVRFAKMPHFLPSPPSTFRQIVRALFWHAANACNRVYCSKTACRNMDYWLLAATPEPWEMAPHTCSKSLSLTDASLFSELQHGVNSDSAKSMQDPEDETTLQSSEARTPDYMSPTDSDSDAMSKIMILNRLTSSAAADALYLFRPECKDTVEGEFMSLPHWLLNASQRQSPEIHK